MRTVPLMIATRCTTVKARFSLDTNVLVYAVDRDAGREHAQSRALIGRAALRDCVLTVQALAEFYRAKTRKALLEPTHAGAFVRDWLDVFDVAARDDRALIEAIDAPLSIGFPSGMRCSGRRSAALDVRQSSAKTCRTVAA